MSSTPSPETQPGGSGSSRGTIGAWWQAYREPAARWSKILGRFLSFEILTKAVMFLTSLLIVRSMAKTDYAWYTIANSMIAGMTMLSSVGVGTALISMGGERLGDRAAMGRLIATCLRYRWMYAAIFAPVVLGLLASMLGENGCPPATTALLVVIVGLFLLIEIQLSLRAPLLQLDRRYSLPQATQSGTAMLRLAGISLLLWWGLDDVWTLLLLTVLLQAAAYYSVIRPTTRKYFLPQQPREPEVGKRIRFITYNTLPETLSAFIMPQVTVILIAFFGNTENVADVGALGRLVLIFSIPQALNHGIFIPLLARTTPGPKLYRNFAFTVVIAFCTAAAIVAVTSLFPNLFLSLLGEGYQHLALELVLVAASSGIAFAFGSLRTVLTAKGWVGYLWLQPIINVLSLVGCLPFFDLSNMAQVLTMNLFRQVFPAVFVVVMVVRAFWLAEEKKRAEARA